MAARSIRLRRDIARGSSLPLPDLQARLTGPLASLLARAAGADEEHVTADLRAFPETMDEVDSPLTGGIARTDPPDALALQLILTTKTLWRYPQLRPILDGRPSMKLALEMDVPLPGECGADAARVGGGGGRLSAGRARRRPMRGDAGARAEMAVLDDRSAARTPADRPASGSRPRRRQT